PFPCSLPARPAEGPIRLLRLGPSRASFGDNAAGYGRDEKRGTATMQLEILRATDAKDAPALAPDDRPIALVHLARPPLGARGLEREVLQLFDRQSTLLIARMRAAAPGAIAHLAHTMNGSARGIGAWRVARAAEALELAGSADAVAGALDQLAAASEEACAL